MDTDLSIGCSADELLNVARIDEADEVVAIPQRPGIKVDWPGWVDQASLACRLAVFLGFFVEFSGISFHFSTVFLLLWGNRHDLSHL